MVRRMEGAGRFLSPVLNCGFSRKFYTFVLLCSALPPPAGVKYVLMSTLRVLGGGGEEGQDREDPQSLFSSSLLGPKWCLPKASHTARLSAKQFFLMGGKWGPSPVVKYQNIQI